MSEIRNFFIANETNNYRPQVLSHKAFLVYGVVLIVLRLLLGAASAAGGAVDAGTLMGLVNRERESRNVSTLYTSAKLSEAAGRKAQDMIDRDYFAHIDPDGSYVWGRITAAGYVPYKILGENLAINFSTSEGMVQAWLQSPKHRDNLLNPEFVDQGLAALYGDYQGRYTNLTASLFGALASGGSDETVKAAVEPPPPAEILETRSAAADVISPSMISPLFTWARVVFTLFGLLLLGLLAVDSFIIFRHNKQAGRSHPSYHFSSFFLFVLISIVVWWW